jgi:hypothetical protein
MKIEKMNIVRSNRGLLGWSVDYKTLETISKKASESVSLEQVEAVILVLVDEHFLKMED